MKRVGINVAVSILAFSIGTLAWVLNPLSRKSTSNGLMTVLITPSSSFREYPNAPMALTITPSSDPTLVQQYSETSLTVTVRNVSDKTIRGYSLGHTCDCRSWDSDGNLYPIGETYLNPAPDHQTLLPGESQQLTLSIRSNPSTAPRVWVDLVHFTDGSNWGPNRGHKEGYVRE
jgi:hypothetical protein